MLGGASVDGPGRPSQALRDQADAVNKQISSILADALSGTEQRYVHFGDGQFFIKWGQVEREIHLVVESGLGYVRDLELKDQL